MYCQYVKNILEIGQLVNVIGLSFKIFLKSEWKIGQLIQMGRRPPLKRAAICKEKHRIDENLVVYCCKWMLGVELFAAAAKKDTKKVNPGAEFVNVREKRWYDNQTEKC